MIKVELKGKEGEVRQVYPWIGVRAGQRGCTSHTLGQW